MKALSLRLFVNAGVARGVSAVGSLALVLVVGNYGDANMLGTFALGQTALLLCVLVSRFGLDRSLTRFVAQVYDGTSDTVSMQLLRKAITLALLLSLPSSFLMFLASHFILPTVVAADTAVTLEYLSFGLVPLTLSLVLSGFFKGVNWSTSAALLESGIVSLHSVILVLVAVHFRELDIRTLTLSFTIACWLTLLHAGMVLIFWKNTVSKTTSKAVTIPDSQLLRTSFDFFVISLSAYLIGAIAIFVAGSMLSEHHVGIFRGAERLVLLISFSLMVVNAVMPQRFARAYHSGDTVTLQREAKRVAALSSAVSLPLFLLFLFFAERTMKLLGDDFAGYGLVLIIMATGQMFNVVTGPAGFILGMAGREREVRMLINLTLFLALILYPVLAHFFGLVGIAIAYSTLLFVQQGLQVMLLRRLLGIRLLI